MLNSGLIGRKIRCSRTLGPWLRIVALTAVAIFLSTATAIPAQAQQQDARTKKARELFLKGVDAFDAGRYQDARGLFLQVWNLKKAPVVLLNLGQSELRAGLNEDGGNHLQQFLREHNTATPSQKATAEKGIETAKRRTGYVILISDVDNALISIDNVAVGRSPLLDPVFVKPGKHVASGSVGAKSVRQNFVARRGNTSSVSLFLKGAVAATPPPVAPAPAATAPVPPAPAAAPTQAPPRLPAAGAPASSLPPPALIKGPKREAPIKWFKRKKLAWVGAGLVGLGLIGGVSFGIAAANASSSIVKVENTILTEANSGKAGSEIPNSYRAASNGQPQPCGSEDGSKPALPYYADACKTLRSNLSTYDVDIAMMTTSIVIGTLAAGGTVLYYFLDTDPKKKDQNIMPRTGILGVAPMVAPNTGGAGIFGAF